MSQSDNTAPLLEPPLDQVKDNTKAHDKGAGHALNFGLKHVSMFLAAVGVVMAVYCQNTVNLNKINYIMNRHLTFNATEDQPENNIDPVENDKNTVAVDEIILSRAELAKYDGGKGSPGLYLAILGIVYDVSKGKEYYGPGGGYSFFAGKDASRAFITGQFDAEGLVDDLSGLSSSDYLGLEEWASFYKKDYVRVGLLEGTFYDDKGEVTQHWKDLQSWIETAKKEREMKDVEKQRFPPCNVEWTKAEGRRFWCTSKSGGVARDWVGVPRQLYYPGKKTRCACVRDSGPNTDSGDGSGRGDLDSPHIKEYKDCDSKASECRVKK